MTVDSQYRVVTSVPLVELWDSSGTLDAFRVGNLGETDIVALLRDGSSFVVADVGQPLRWISESERFAFWKSEVKCRLVPPDADGFSLDDYPTQYCYVATVWRCMPSTTVIVLDKHH